MPERTPTVFVSDASAEAVRIGDALRAAGYLVVDVPLSMLISRASVQRPHVVLLDADAHGALDAVLELRRLPGSGGVDFIYVGAGGGAIKDADDALAHEASAYFARPVDIDGLVRKVEALTGGPASSATHDVRSSTPPPSISPSRSTSAALPAPGVRAGVPPLPMSAPSLVDLVDPPRSLATFGTVSSELAQLLEEAEVRAEASATPDVPLPTPEEEIEAVLPADVLDSLDEPLEEGEEEGEGGVDAFRTGPGFVDREGTGALAKGTTAGGAAKQTTGGGRAATPIQTRERRSSVPASRQAAIVPSMTPRSEIKPSHLPTVLPTPAESRGPSAPPEADRGPSAVLVGPNDARAFLAEVVARRATGAACFESEGELRRVVLRDGDFVTAASGAERESLVHFLGARGELPKDEVERLGGKVPPHGRHAGAALVAHGFLRQDQLWEVLRAHAEWIATAVLRIEQGTARVEVEPPGRLRSEPSVFGASTGSEIFVELVRRAVSTDEALDRLGGESSRIGDGPNQGLLAECALPPQEMDLLSRARGGTIGDLLARSPDGEIISVLHALALLGVIDVVPAPDFVRGKAAEIDPNVVLLDEDAIRARVRARLELVDEGDYFSVLGVPREATSYEVRRAFLELRRAFDPSRLLTPSVADLAPDVRKIVTVLEEAYDILRDGARRERYRRAIDARPE